MSEAGLARSHRGALPRGVATVGVSAAAAMALVVPSASAAQDPFQKALEKCGKAFEKADKKGTEKADDKAMEKCTKAMEKAGGGGGTPT